ncbi:MAG: FG-GAP repeat domain-containing protein [Planctomycetota bacterium]|jgi:hypothetical protein
MLPTSTSRLRAVAAALAVPALAGGAFAQQFTFVNVIPGPNRWTEGLEAADVDNDGDFDLFFADGDGFSTPGTQRQNVLVINQLESAPGTFTDESVARLGVNTSHARMAFTGDIDGDGWIDAMFANGFNTDLPFLYHNRGAGQPGFFDQEGTARGFTEIYATRATASWVAPAIARSCTSTTATASSPATPPSTPCRRSSPRTWTSSGSTSTTTSTWTSSAPAAPTTPVATTTCC